MYSLDHRTDASVLVQNIYNLTAMSKFIETNMYHPHPIQNAMLINLSSFSVVLCPGTVYCVSLMTMYKFCASSKKLYVLFLNLKFPYSFKEAHAA